MPSPMMQGVARPTVDLHAPWWNPTRTLDGTPNSRTLADDEPGGRYLERWVVYAGMTERDEQVISANLNPRVLMQNAGSKTKATQEMVMRDLPFSRLYYLMQMTREVTTERGEPQHLSKEFFNALDQKDTKWVESQMGKLYQRDVVETLEEDEEESERLLAAHEADGDESDAGDPSTHTSGEGPSLLEMSAQGVAQSHFRASGSRRASR